MSRKILVTYASRTGSTAEIAEAISKVVAEYGAQVDLLPMPDVKDVSAYRAVVVGSAIRKSKWLPEAMQFVQTHHAKLVKRPVATFTVCITLAMSNSAQYRQAIAEWIQPVRAQVGPVSEGLFAGRLDFSKLPLTFDTLLFRVAVVFGIIPRDDRRDWNAIRAWTESIIPLLQ